MIRKKILAVDLDNTLVKTDISFETVIEVLRHSPHKIIKAVILFIFRGKGSAKKFLSDNTAIDVENLPYNNDVLEYIKLNRDKYDKLILISGSHEDIVKRVGKFLDCFDHVAGTTNVRNLVGINKVEYLREHFTDYIFDYIGDSKKDIPIWECSHNSIIVSSQSLLNKLKNKKIKKNIISQNYDITINDLFYLLRVHHWVKNLLVFLPMLLSQEISTSNVLILLQTFIAFSFISSSVYILNDLVDSNIDRKHPSKKNRPLPSGKIQITDALFYLILFSSLSIILSINISLELLTLIIFYFLLSTAYTLYLKILPYVDIIVLSSFFLLRIYSGGYAIEVDISHWLFIFSILFFISMASIKRIIEIKRYNDSILIDNGRPYMKKDLNFLTVISYTFGYLSIFIFILYIFSEHPYGLYSNANYLLPVSIFLIFWITRVFYLTSENLIQDDPIIFSIKDKMSYLIITLIVLFFYISSNFY